MRRFGLIMLCEVLSGGFAAAASATLCEPMPCCVNQPAALNTVSDDCCGITAGNDEQPQNLVSKQTVMPNVEVSVLRPVAQRSVRIAATILANNSSPPTTRERLSTLAVLLI